MTGETVRPPSGPMIFVDRGDIYLLSTSAT